MPRHVERYTMQNDVNYNELEAKTCRSLHHATDVTTTTVLSVWAQVAPKLHKRTHDTRHVFFYVSGLWSLTERAKTNNTPGS
jgi:hypothetical protein